MTRCLEVCPNCGQRCGRDGVRHTHHRCPNINCRVVEFTDGIIGLELRGRLS